MLFGKLGRVCEQGGAEKVGNGHYLRNGKARSAIYLLVGQLGRPMFHLPSTIQKRKEV